MLRARNARCTSTFRVSLGSFEQAQASPGLIEQALQARYLAT
jgi:hypothetical protein